jgi:chromosome segregation ATPase
LTTLLARQCPRRNKERDQAHAAALAQLEEATKQAEYRKRIANAEISRARKREEKAVENLQAETAKLDPIRKSADELRAKVETLERQLKAAELRTDDLAQKLSQERNRLLQLKFKNTLGVDVGIGGQAGNEAQDGAATQGKGDAALAQARLERQHIKRLVDFFKHKLAADLEAWRRDGCARMLVGLAVAPVTVGVQRAG